MASIEVRGKCQRVYLRFRYLKKEYRLATSYHCDRSGSKGCSCRGCKSGIGLGYEIERKISDKTFSVSSYFPNFSSRLSPSFFSPSGDLLFSSYASLYFDYMKPILASSTYHTYYYAYHVLCRYIASSTKLSDFTPLFVKSLVSHLVSSGISSKTLRNYIGTLRSILSQAVLDGFLSVNPCLKVQLPRVFQSKIDPFSKSEISAILCSCDVLYPHLTLFFAIGFYTGLRPGENLALQWSDIDFIHNRISISKTFTHGKLKLSTKTNSDRFVDIIPSLDKYLQTHKRYSYVRQSFLYFESGNFIRSTSRLCDVFKSVCHHSGVRFRVPYQMRHTFATMMLGAGEDPNWVKSMLGHRDLTMLFKVYGNWYIPREDIRAGSKFELSS